MMSVHASECYMRYDMHCAMMHAFPDVEKHIRGSPSGTMLHPLMQVPASTRTSFYFFIAGYRLPQIASSAMPPIPLRGLWLPIIS